MGGIRLIVVGGILTVGSIAAASSTVQDIAVTDQTADESVLFAADRIERADNAAPIIAEGNVRAFYADQSLLADRVTYDPETDIVSAEGNVVIYDADGQVYFAETVELTGDLRDGVATNFGALIAEQSRLVGSTVVRRSNGVNSIENGSYTGCRVCREDGSKKTPTWQVKAFRVTQDKNDQTISFEHATIEAFGVPIFYTPYFEFPDPSLERKTGFLAPSLGNSTRAGIEAEMPFYWAISDYQDATFSPRYTAELGTIWKGEYRVKTHDASAIIQTGFVEPSGIIRNTDPNDPNFGLFQIATELSSGRIAELNSLGDTSVDTRWHIFAGLEQELNHGWVGNLDIDYVSDKNYLRTYDIQPEDELSEAVDILQPDRLENTLSFTRQTDDYYTDISAVLFQSLRRADDNDFGADVMPRIRHERFFELPYIGGDLTIGADVLVLHRRQGVDSMRALSRVSYDKVYTTRNGHRLRGFAELRGDVYRYTDANQGIEGCRDGAEVNGEIISYEECRSLLPRDGLDEEFSSTRLLPTTGVEWSFPLAKFTPDASFVIEPRVQVVVSPEEDFRDDVFNEDSAFFEFDSITLFDWNKSAGFDRWEDGQRLNMGLRASANYTSGINISGAIGQQLRANESVSFDDDTGLGDSFSDIVGELNAGYKDNLVMTNRFRIDDADGTLQRLETSLRAKRGRASGGLSYVRTEVQELSASGRRDEYATFSAFYEFTPRVTAGGIWREDLDAGETTTQQFVLQFEDDCTVFSLAYRYDNLGAAGLDDNRSVTFNVDVLGF